MGFLGGFVCGVVFTACMVMLLVLAFSIDEDEEDEG